MIELANVGGFFRALFFTLILGVLVLYKYSAAIAPHLPAWLSHIVYVDQAEAPAPEVPSERASVDWSLLYGPKQRSTVRDAIQEAADRFSVDQDLVRAVIFAESGFDPNALSSKGAKGLMQLMPHLANKTRDGYDPRENILGGAEFLSQLLRQYHGDVRLAVAAYNAGPKAVEQFRGVPPYSLAYVNRVVAFYKFFKGS